jgi:hypothetical protein
VGIEHLHRKYELKEAISYLDEPESKTKWTRTVKEAVYKKWGVASFEQFSTVQVEVLVVKSILAHIVRQVVCRSCTGEA